MLDVASVKARVSMADVVRMYGIEISRSGFCRCPFHEERTGSMKIYDDGFHCFGCGAHGDQIEFIKRMDGCSFLEAFRILGGDPGQGKPKRQPPKKTEAQKRAEKLSELYERYSSFCSRLHDQEDIRDKAEPFSDRWCSSVNEIQKINNELDSLWEMISELRR